MFPVAARIPVAGIAFVALADTAIVALALPPILLELDTDVAGVAAVLGVYAVTLAAALPIAERARELAGTRAVGVAGVVLFTLGSLVCGLAGSLAVLLAARAVQAAGGAALLVTAYALLAGERASARSWRLAVLLGTAAGPALGGALTQAFGWRSIFLVQVPAALAALPGCLAAGRRSVPIPAAQRHAGAPAEPRPGAASAARFRLALALVSGAIAAALFLTVLLLISGWGIDPLAAAAAVTIMPLAALAAWRVGGSPRLRAAGGCLLVAAGSASLAFLPTASVAWTVAPQLAVGVGMGFALPALAGELLPERGGRDAAGLLTVRHAGIALALLLLAPIAQHELDSTLEATRERGAALVLDAPFDPGLKIDLAPELADSVATEDPRGGLDEAFADGRGAVDEDQLPAYDALTRQADDTLVEGVNRGFAAAFLVGAALALVGAVALLPGVSVRRPAIAAGVAAAALLAPAGYALAAETARPEPVRIEDPCEDRELPDSGGAGGLIQDAALVALDHVACRAGSSREELVIALVDDESAQKYEDRYGVDPRSALDLLEVALPG
jgi:predicted MFS family arabinose efflux permease